MQWKVRWTRYDEVCGNLKLDMETENAVMGFDEVTKNDHENNGAGSSEFWHGNRCNEFVLSWCWMGWLAFGSWSCWRPRPWTRRVSILLDSCISTFSFFSLLCIASIPRRTPFAKYANFKYTFFFVVYLKTFIVEDPSYMQSKLRLGGHLVANHLLK